MKPILPKLIPTLLALISLNAIAVTRYVDLNSPSPTPPYTSWLTAATNIQDAIDAASAGDVVLVTNGVYRTSLHIASDGTSNRVAVTRPLTLVSVNGAAVTTIDGENLLRCVYLTNGAALIGFTLTNGIAVYGGGVWSASLATVVSNCLMISNSAVSFGGGAYAGTLVDSVLRNNQAGNGGGAAANKLNNCTVVGNFSPYGGGVFAATLTNCTIIDNVAHDGAAGVLTCVLSQCLLSNNIVTGGGGGGGALSSSLYQCIITGNQTTSGGGGGTAGGSVHQCVISNNVAYQGGGTDTSFVNQSIVIGNTAWRGGGSYRGSILNSIIVGNLAFDSGGGTDGGCSLLNSVVYYNSAPANTNYGPADFFNSSCTTPLPFPPYSPGSFSGKPLFVDMQAGNFQLRSNSPCINSGSDPVYWPDTNSTDYAGQSRKVGGAMDVGAYEYQSPASSLSYAWAQQYGLPTDGTVDFLDMDGDGANNWQESRADTIPTNAFSVLKIVSVTNDPSGISVTWQSVDSRKYWLERATNLNSPSPFQAIYTQFPGSSGMTTLTDNSAGGTGPYFYRVGVH